jgi:uncharacterized membrane protein
MKNSNALVYSALAGVLALGLTGPGDLALAAEKEKGEKCYGVSKAGKNDCGTATHSCAGTQKVDADAHSWIYLPKGACEKVVNGSLQPAKGSS